MLKTGLAEFVTDSVCFVKFVTVLVAWLEPVSERWSFVAHSVRGCQRLSRSCLEQT